MEKNVLKNIKHWIYKTKESVFKMSWCLRTLKIITVGKSLYTTAKNMQQCKKKVQYETVQVSKPNTGILPNCKGCFCLRLM